jgi:hypothetical protein
MNRTKVLSFTVLLFFIFLASINLQAQSAVGTPGETPAYITAYKEEGFRGESEKFLIGEYRTMPKGWKDEIKSIAISGAVRVTIYDKEQYAGDKVVVEHSIPKLPGEMRGEASSMQVEPFSCSYIVAFKKTMFEGDSREFRAGEYPELDGGWDDMQSIHLCGGMSVTVYTKKNFEGESATINNGRIDLGKFRKKVESMKVTSSTTE